MIENTSYCFLAKYPKEIEREKKKEREETERNLYILKRYSV